MAEEPFCVHQPRRLAKAIEDSDAHEEHATVVI